MKKVTIGCLLLGAVVVAGTVWADGWRSWFGGKDEAKPMAAAAAPGAPAASPMAMLGNALDIQENDRIVGSMTAPVTLIEYASLTCSHCADFATRTMPSVKKEWVDTGKVKYVMRDLAWDNLAVGMAKIARCAEPAQFFPLTNAFFMNQKMIVTSNDALGEIKKVAAPFGMDEAKVEACIKDGPLQTQVEESKRIAMEVLGVRGTPAIFINGVKVDGAVDYKTLKPTLDTAYAKAIQAK